MKMSEEHKRKISISLQKYHAQRGCHKKKPKSKIDLEINRLLKQADRNIKKKEKEKLLKEIKKLRKI